MPHAKTDVLALTRHLELWRDDLQLVKMSGIDSLRYPAPWHRLEPRPGRFEWGWMDEVLGHMRELGLDPIVDLVHHTSFPDWLTGGFANPGLPGAEEEYAHAFAERYPWVRRYTVFNEPMLTTFLCSHEGVWYPYGRDPQGFVRMLSNVGRAICRTSEMLLRTLPDVQLVHVDTCEHHKAMDRESEPFVRFINDRRFVMHDLVLSRIDTSHPLYRYLSENGLEDEDLAWFAEHPARIDVLGLDYYCHSEYQFYRCGPVVPSKAPSGFAEVARQYLQRYQLPVMLSETNIRGFSTDRLSWCKYMVEQCEQLVAEGVDFHGFCWFPFIDSTDWDSLLRCANGNVDPQGIYWLDPARETRHASRLSSYFTLLARGEVTSADVPAYRFQPPVDEQLEGHLPQMAHWEWLDAPEA